MWRVSRDSHWHPSCYKTASCAYTRGRDKIQTDSGQDAILALYRERGAAMSSLARSIMRGLADPADAVASAITRLVAEGSADPLRLEQLVKNEARSLRTKTLRNRRREAPFGLLTDLALLEERVEDERAAKGQPLTQELYDVGRSLTFEGVTFQQDFDLAVRELPDPERDAFFLTELRGISDREAAELLGVSHMTVNRRATVAITNLREELTL